MVNLPKYTEFMSPTLRVIDQSGGSASIEEIKDGVSNTMSLTQEQLDSAHPKSGSLITPNRMAWARSYLKNAGFLESGGRGIWVLTDAGRQALTLTPMQLQSTVRKVLREQNAKANSQKNGTANSGPVDDEAIETDQHWSEKLLVCLREMPPAGFERLSQRLLRESGFVKVEVTGKSGDGGIDGAGVLRMNLISFQVLFQCKRYTGSVGSEAVRNFRGAMQGRADKGLIITTGTFTAEARKEATRDGAPAIDLIDGEALCQILKDKSLGISVKQVIREEIEIDSSFFAEV